MNDEILLINDIIWYVTFSNLLVLMWISAYMYKNIKDRSFLFYSLYCFFLSLYAVTRNSSLYNYFPEFINSNFIKICYWYTQVLFYSSLFYFSFYFLNIKKYFPRVFYIANKYLTIANIISLPLVVYCFITGNNSLFANYFTFLFVPTLTCLGLFIISISFRVSGNSRLYFLTAMTIYTSFALIGFYKFNIFGIFYAISPNSLFFIGVLIEGNIFAIGLAQRIRKIYEDKYKFQKELNIANEKLNSQLISEKEKLQIELEKLDLQKQIIDLEFNVINAQMNSHFLFNVLNSIKSYIIENNDKTAINYINKYGKFIRRILDVNRGSSHVLKDEINIIENYLQIEQLRLQHSFEYVIQNNLKEEDLQIPFPHLLLQPLIENSIWHGLMKIETNRKIIISFI